LKSFVTFIALFLFIFSIARANEPVMTDTLSVGDKLPPLIFKNDSGKIITTDSLHGKTTMLIFFATWCPPCRAELPFVQKDIWLKLKDNKKFVLLVVGREHTLKELEKFKKKNKFTFPVVPDSGRIIYSHFAPQLIPRTYLIDKNGKIIRSVIGFNEKDFAETKEMVEKELNSNK
jgi:peroxiredoxin